MVKRVRERERESKSVVEVTKAATWQQSDGGCSSGMCRSVVLLVTRRVVGMHRKKDLTGSAGAEEVTTKGKGEVRLTDRKVVSCLECFDRESVVGLWTAKDDDPSEDEEEWDAWRREERDEWWTSGEEATGGRTRPAPQRTRVGHTTHAQKTADEEEAGVSGSDFGRRRTRRKRRERERASWYNSTGRDNRLKMKIDPLEEDASYRVSDRPNDSGSSEEGRRRCWLMIVVWRTMMVKRAVTGLREREREREKWWNEAEWEATGEHVPAKGDESRLIEKKRERERSRMTVVEGQSEGDRDEFKVWREWDEDWYTAEEERNEEIERERERECVLCSQNDGRNATDGCGDRRTRERAREEENRRCRADW
jgi:hypothetical protein